MRVKLLVFIKKESRWNHWGFFFLLLTSSVWIYCSVSRLIFNSPAINHTYNLCSKETSVHHFSREYALQSCFCFEDRYEDNFLERDCRTTYLFHIWHRFFSPNKSKYFTKSTGVTYRRYSSVLCRKYNIFSNRICRFQIYILMIKLEIKMALYV